MLPVAQRTPEWTQAVSKAVNVAVVSKERPASRLFGHYYDVPLALSEVPEPDPDNSMK